MTINEIKTKVEALLNKGPEYTEAEQTEINEISLATLREPVKECNCTNRWFDALVKVRKWLKQHTELNTCKYEMVRGELFRMNGEMFTNANLTDEAAEWFIANFPDAAKRIIKKIINDEVVTTKKKVTKRVKVNAK